MTKDRWERLLLALALSALVLGTACVARNGMRPPAVRLAAGAASAK